MLKPKLPAEALVNVRDQVRIYFGNSNKVDDRLIDLMINNGVQTIHQKWHPRWTIITADLEVSGGATARLVAPKNFKKAIAITDQNFPPSIVYRNGVNYSLRGFTDEEIRKKFFEWISPKPDTGNTLAVRLYYFRQAIFASSDTDLVDVDSDTTFLVNLYCQYQIMLQRGNNDEYDRLRQEFFAELQNFIDDDTEPDIESITKPRTADNFIHDMEFGQVTGIVDTLRESDIRLDNT